LWVSIATNRHTGRSKGYGFVHVATEADAKRAIKELCGKKVHERRVSVHRANDPISWGSPHRVKVETTISSPELREAIGSHIPEAEKSRTRIALEHVVAAAEGRSVYITYDTREFTDDDIRDLFEQYQV
jgi:RNA recognition motif-containing protein